MHHRRQGRREDRRDPAERRREGHAREERQERPGGRRHLQEGLKRRERDAPVLDPQKVDASRPIGAIWRGAMHRRTFLAALAAAPLLSLARSSRAQSAPPPRSRSSATRSGRRCGSASITRRSRAAGYHDDTVIVFVPSHYRFHDDEGVATLVHMHGHTTTAERAMVAHQLREQVADSKQNALLVVPQLAVMAADSSCGRLESPGGSAEAARRGRRDRVARGPHDPRRHGLSARRAARHDVRQRALGRATTPRPAACVQVGSTCARPTSSTRCTRGRHVPRLGRGAPRRAAPPAPQARELLHGGRADRGERPRRSARSSNTPACSAKKSCRRGSSRATTSRTPRPCSCARASGTRQVTWETNALRDCLFASALPRHVASSWFARKSGARPIRSARRQPVLASGLA